MMHPHHKFLWILSAVVLVFGVIVWYQGKRAASIVVTPSGRSLIANGFSEIPISPEDQLYGNPGAPLTLVEFIDLGDSQSITLHQTLYSFAKAHPKEVRLVWKDFPTAHLFSGDATSVHIAAWCAGAQNHFWDFISATSTRARHFSATDLTNTAIGLGVDTTNWRTCVANSDPRLTITNSVALATSLGFTGAPALFINNKQLDLTQHVDLPALLNSLISK